MDKTKLKNELIASLKDQDEIEKIIIFGSFNSSVNPNDMDVAVIQNSDETYLTLALKYRKLIRNVSREVAVDIIPIIKQTENSFYKTEIETGEVIYAKGN